MPNTVPPTDDRDLQKHSSQRSWLLSVATDLRGRSVSGIRVGDWKDLIDDSSKKEAPKSEVELTAEEQKLPRRERKALIKERAKAAAQNRGPTAALYNLTNDLGEQNNLLAKHPEIVVRLRKLLDDFGRELRANSRPAGVASQ